MIAYYGGLVGDIMSQTTPGTSLQVWRLNQPENRAPRRPEGAESRVMQIMKNSGNEAKKWLKTKDITFLNDANFALFACRSTQIKASKEQKRHILSKQTETCKSQGETGTVASARLRRTAVTPGYGSLPGGNVR
jgi:hypothetical protein